MTTTIPVTARKLLVDQLQLLSNEGWQVHLVTSPGPGYRELRVATSGIANLEMHPIPMERLPSPRADLRALVTWRRLLNEIRPDVTFVGTPKASLLCNTAAWISGVRVRIYLIRGLRLEGLTGVPAAVGWIAEKVTCATSTSIVCVSSSLRDALVSKKISRSSKSHVIGAGSSNGVDTARFRPVDTSAKERARGDLGLPIDGFVIGYCGRLSQDKGLGPLLSAFARLRERHAATYLLILGDPDPTDPLSADVRGMLTSERVRWLPHREDVLGFFAALDVYCLPSLREGLPNSVLEASAMGLPVVTTRATGCRDSVVDGVTGLLCEAGSAVSLEAALEAIVEDPAFGRHLGAQGRSWVMGAFEAQLVQRATCDFINRLSPG